MSYKFKFSLLILFIVILIFFIYFNISLEVADNGGHPVDLDYILGKPEILPTKPKRFKYTHLDKIEAELILGKWVSVNDKNITVTFYSSGELEYTSPLTQNKEHSIGIFSLEGGTIKIDPHFKLNNTGIRKIISNYEIINETLVIKNTKFLKNEKKPEDRFSEKETSDFFLKLDGTYKLGK